LRKKNLSLQLFRKCQLMGTKAAPFESAPYPPENWGLHTRELPMTDKVDHSMQRIALPTVPALAADP
jgi:hypothetical protein